jgi:hypothetical protein
MCVYVCVCVCMYVYVCVCMFVRVCVSLCLQCALPLRTFARSADRVGGLAVVLTHDIGEDDGIF